MTRSPKLIVMIIALLTASLLTACDDLQMPADRAEAAAPQSSPRASQPKQGLCPKAGPITRSLLPSPAGVDQVATNPCLGVNGLVDLAMQTIPAEQRSDQEVKRFRTGLLTFAKRAAVASDALECAYRNDHLAVAVYRDPRHTWSVGLVAVVRGDVRALAEDAVCLLLEQLPFVPGVRARAERPPVPKFCADAVSRKAQGYNFLILWIADSDQMCLSLDETIRRRA